MARLYPPITDEKLPAFCLTYNDKGEKIGATIKVNFNLNRAVANNEISGIALRLRTISTNTLVVSENLAVNPNIGQNGRSEGKALSFDLVNGSCIFSITKEYNEEAIEKLKVGQYYKLQLAFINLNNIIGYWSTVATIKCVAEPTVRIANFHVDDINVFNNEIVGEYIQDITAGDYTEKIYSYNFQLFDIDGETIREETGEKLHNSSDDTASSTSTDIYYCYQDLDENEIYYIQYNVTTVNGLKISSPKYQLVNIGSIPPEQEIILNVFNGTENNYNYNRTNWLPYDEGVIETYIDFEEKKNTNKKLTGNFVLTRSSSKDNYSTWQEVRRFRLNNETPSEKIIYDYTVEQGINYKYAIQQYNRQGFYSSKVYAQNLNQIGYKYNKEKAVSIKADFEDMFLYDGKRQLKIRFNPKVSSFKNDLQEQKIDTIGSKYPFIFRNGNVCYKEFPISGLISFQEDNALFFTNDEDYSQMELERFEQNGLRYSPDYNTDYKKLTRRPLRNKDFPLYIYVTEEVNSYDKNNSHEMLHHPTETLLKSYYKQIDSLATLNNYKQEQNISEDIPVYKKTSTLINGYSDIDRSKTYNKTDLTSDNIMSERYFKLSVLDWLTDGKPKLFRSPTEGNYIVRLLNVSLTPLDQLGRMLHSFTATAYEIAEFNYNSLVELGLLTVQEPFGLEFQWESRNIRNFLLNNASGVIDENGDTYYSVDLNEKEIYGFSVTGFAPGDKIKIITSDDAVPIIITIGQTGSYIYENATPLVNFSISPQNNTGDFPRDLQFKLQGYNYQKFDLISSINVFTQKGQQIIGEKSNIFEKAVVNSKYNNISNYWLMNNIYLSESFEPVRIDKDTYNKNLYYIENNKGYKLPYTNGVKNQFNANLQYYKRKYVGEKIISTDLLYLHAKRREVIPIFIFNINHNHNYRLETYLNSNTVQFTLTPFGNGYVHYKNVSPDFNISNYDVLTAEERTRAMEVNDLVDFVIKQCGMDQFCLFEVYVPRTKSNSRIIDWVPYATAGSGAYPYYGGSNLCGIFDPYLYNIEKNSKGYLAGWWGKTFYNPVFTIGYDEDENYNEELVSLKDKVEISLKNIKTPTLLTTGTGVVMEIFYRIKYIDYTIEKEQPAIAKKKNAFLTAVSNAQKYKSIYRLQSYFKPIGENLTQNYSQDLEAIINNDINYIETVEKLTELARVAQINTTKNYLRKEQSTVYSILGQLSAIDDSLTQNLGLQKSVFYSSLNTARDNYSNYITNTLNLTDNNFLPILNQYKKKTANITGTKTLLERYYKNIEKNSSWNFITKINTILSNLQTAENDIGQEIMDLEDKQYVSQYLELLQKRGSEIFLQNYTVDDTHTYSIANWINKKQISSFDFNTDLTDEIWDSYFHISDTLETIDSIDYSDENEIYYISNLENYLQSNDNNPINTSTSYIYKEKFDNNKNLITLISEGLNALNSLSRNTMTPNEYKNAWGIDWNLSVPSAFDLYGTSLASKKQYMGLGNIKISNNTYVLEKSLLELQIDEAFENNMLSKTSSLATVKSFLNSDKYCKSFPQKLKDKLASIILTYITGLRTDFENIYSFYEYSVTPGNMEKLTDEQKAFIQAQFKNYYNNLNNNTNWTDILDLSNSSSDYYKFYNSNSGSFKRWYEDYYSVGEEESPEIINKIAEINEYRTKFNSIINKVKNSISKFKKYRNKIIALNNKPGIKPSDNIRLILYEEKEYYQIAIQEIQEILSYFKFRLSDLQDEYKYDGYLDFLTSYLNLYNSEETYSIDEDYKQFVQQAIRIKSINANYAPSVQDASVATAWKNFLDILSKTYKKIEEKGSLS